jgi:hypothetical protein
MAGGWPTAARLRYMSLHEYDRFYRKKIGKMQLEIKRDSLKNIDFRAYAIL